jgi:hypothetical protein
MRIRITFNDDPDADPACHFDVDAGPSFHFDADADPDPDQDPSFEIKAQNRIQIQLITLMRMRIHADPDPQHCSQGHSLQALAQPILARKRPLQSGSTSKLSRS